MGTSKSFAELAGKLEAAARKVRTDSSILEGAAFQVKKAVQVELRKVAPSGRLSGVGKSGARVGVRYQRMGRDAFLVKMTGPAHLIERDTDPHTIGPKRSRQRKAKGRRTAVALNGEFRAVVRHPGTRGQHPWEKGVKRSGQPVRKDFAKSVAGLLGEVF